MSLIGRYIFKQIAFAFALSLSTLIALLWLVQAMSQVRLVMSEGQTVSLFFEVTLLALPSLIVFIAPVALLISVLFALNRLNNDSELVVVSAAGAPRRAIIKPVMFAALLVMLLTGILSVFVQPESSRGLKEVMTQVRADVIASFAREGRFTQVSGLTLHIRERDLNNTLLGLMLHDERDPGAVSTYLAERGRIVRDENGAFLVMENGSIQRGGGSPEAIDMVAFERYVYDLSEFTEARPLPFLHPRERTTYDLLFPDTSETYYQERLGRFRSELHGRFSEMLYPLAFAAIALATVGFARSARQTRMTLVVVAVVWAVGLRFLGFAFLNLTRGSVWPIYLLYGMPIAAITFALAIATGLTATYQQRLMAWWRDLPLEDFAQRTGIARVRDWLMPRLSAFLQRYGFQG